jgi:hypothetical protein
MNLNTSLAGAVLFALGSGIAYQSTQNSAPGEAAAYTLEELQVEQGRGDGAGGAGGAAAGQQGRAGGGGETQPGEYSRVITSEAATKRGVFITHRIGTRLYYEIPRTELRKEFLLVTQIAKTTLGTGYGGNQVGERVIR